MMVWTCRARGAARAQVLCGGAPACLHVDARRSRRRRGRKRRRRTRTRRRKRSSEEEEEEKNMEEE
eukprot:4713062-Pyramimonas_sp.AAC.1